MQQHGFNDAAAEVGNLWGEGGDQSATVAFHHLPPGKGLVSTIKGSWPAVHLSATDPSHTDRVIMGVTKGKVIAATVRRSSRVAAARSTAAAAEVPIPTGRPRRVKGEPAVATPGSAPGRSGLTEDAALVASKNPTKAARSSKANVAARRHAGASAAKATSSEEVKTELPMVVEKRYDEAIGLPPSASWQRSPVGHAPPPQTQIVSFT